MWLFTAALATVVFSASATADTTVPVTTPVTTADTTVPETVPVPGSGTVTLEFVRVSGGDVGRPGDSYEWAGAITAGGAPGTRVELTVYAGTGWMYAGGGPTDTGTDVWVCLTSPPPPPGQPPTPWYGVMCVADMGETGTITAGVRLTARVSDNAANGAVLGVTVSVGAGSGGSATAADSIVVERVASSPAAPLPGVADADQAAEPTGVPELAQILPETGAGHRAVLLSMGAAVTIFAGVGCRAAARRPGFESDEQGALKPRASR